MQKRKIDESIAVVVGSGRGLGRAVALALAEAGASLFLVSRTEEHLNEVAHEARAFGVDVRAQTADAADPAAVDEFLDVAMAPYGRIDILVNCQGEAQISHLTEISNAAWERVLSQNLSSVFYTCRFAFGRMKMQAGGGQIVNIGSQASIGGSRQALGYLSAKAGVLGLGKALEREGAEHGIRVITICPGAMDTPMRWRATPEMDRDSLLNPNEVAKLIVNLLSYPTLNVPGPLIPVLG